MKPKNAMLIAVIAALVGLIFFLTTTGPEKTAAEPLSIPAGR